MIHLLKRELRLSIRSGGGFGLSLAFFLVASVLRSIGRRPRQRDSATHRTGNSLGRRASGLPSITRPPVPDRLRGWLAGIACHISNSIGERSYNESNGTLDDDWPSTDSRGSHSWHTIEHRSGGLCMASGIARHRNTCAFDDRSVWCSADGQSQARRTASSTIGITSICPDSGLWCGMRTPRCRGLCIKCSNGVSCGHHSCDTCAPALRRSHSSPDQSSIELSLNTVHRALACQETLVAALLRL